MAKPTKTSGEFRLDPRDPRMVAALAIVKAQDSARIGVEVMRLFDELDPRQRDVAIAFLRSLAQAAMSRRPR
jgi:hypothetical protein